MLTVGGFILPYLVSEQQKSWAMTVCFNVCTSEEEAPLSVGNHFNEKIRGNRIVRTEQPFDIKILSAQAKAQNF